MTDQIAEWLVNFIASHPTAVVWALGVYVVCTLVVHGLRLAYPVETERPRWVNFLIGFLDLGALNFWRPVQAITAKSGGTPNV